jgi:uncharacterized repeat protein (TIGR01451 family)
VSQQESPMGYSWSGMQRRTVARAVCALGTSFALLSAAAPVLAGPAAAPTNFSRTTAGAIATTVPDGTCGASIVARGGAGGSQTAGGSGGRGAGGANINATFNVLPRQAVTGTVGQGGRSLSTGGTGAPAGGNGGIATSDHSGAGGGGATAVIVGGTSLIIAGGGGGGGGAHATAGNGGGGGFTGIGASVVAVGLAGANGQENPLLAFEPQGGGGGQAAAGGIAGVNGNNAAYNALAGGGVGAGTGGRGGNDANFDAGGGGGGGYTGGGGGAATVGQASTGAGGGGGSSFVRATSPTVSAPTPTLVSGTAGAQTGGGAINGASGMATLTWIPCDYELVINKTVTPSPVRAGAAAEWTVTVTNNGPDPMTRGDTITLADTLPAGPNGAPTPQFRVLSVSSAGGSNANMSSGAITCTGVTVGSAMPASTVCSRAYAAPAAPGAPSGGTRGLDVNETLTITYEQVISNTAACGTITNTASTADRSTAGSWTPVARSVNRSLTIDCYDLSIAKTRTPSVVGVGNPIDWTIVVTNNGPADMMGPDDTASNPLVVTDVAPVTNVGTPTLFTSSGPAGACSYASPTITCPAGLPAGMSQTFTFRQVVNGGAPNGATITNTASLSDPKTADTNDSQSASSITAAPSAGLTVSKTPSVGSVAAAGTVISYNILVTNSGNTLLGPVTVADPLGSVVCPVSGNATIASLAASTSVTCVMSYTVPQSVLNNNGGGDGDIDNTATASATYAGNPVSGNGSAAVLVVQSPALSITKIATPDTNVTAGGIVTYRFRVTNTGNVTVTGISVSDSSNGLGAVVVASGEVIPPGGDVAPAGDSTDAAANGTWDSLAPGDSVEFTGTYAVQQADLDRRQ